MEKKWEKYIMLVVIGIVIFIGFVSLLYSWIDSVYKINVNPYVLTVIAFIITFGIVFAINHFDPVISNL